MRHVVRLFLLEYIQTQAGSGYIFIGKITSCRSEVTKMPRLTLEVRLKVT